MDDDRIDAGLFEQHHVAGEIARDLLVAHGVAAIFHHDDRVVVMQHMRQRLHQDLGLFLRAFWWSLDCRFGHFVRSG